MSCFPSAYSRAQNGRKRRKENINPPLCLCVSIYSARVNCDTNVPSEFVDPFVHRLSHVGVVIVGVSICADADPGSIRASSMWRSTNGWIFSLALRFLSRFVKRSFPARQRMRKRIRMRKKRDPRAIEIARRVERGRGVAPTSFVCEGSADEVMEGEEIVDDPFSTLVVRDADVLATIDVLLSARDV